MTASRHTIRLLTACAVAVSSWAAPSIAQNYEFQGGYPTPATVKKASDETDLNRAIHAYRFFYPTVSSAAIFREMTRLGVQPNKVFGYMDTQPRHVGFTLNSDTPYGGMLLDLNVGPLIVEIPPGPLLGAVLDINQRWIADMGIPGPDAGKGGKHLLLPPGYEGDIPENLAICNDRFGEGVSRNEEDRVTTPLDAQVHLTVASAGKGDIRASIDVCVVINSSKGPARLRGNGREAAIKARRVDAKATFVSNSSVCRPY